MTLGHKKQFQYFCVTENKWICEERAHDSLPTQCMNDAGHTIKNDSISLCGDHYCTFKNDTNIPEELDLTALNYSSLSTNEKKIVEVLKGLLECARLRRLVNYE